MYENFKKDVGDKFDLSKSKEGAYKSLSTQAAWQGYQIAYNNLPVVILPAKPTPIDMNAMIISGMIDQIYTQLKELGYPVNIKVSQ